MSKLIDINALKNNNDYINNNITEIKDYIGYTDNDIYGLEVDYENNIFTRLAGAVGKSGGSDFNNINAYNRRRCNLTDDGVLIAYYGDTGYTETGALTQAVTVDGTEYPIGTPVQVMVEQPKFYYKVVPLKLDPYTTQNGDTGYHIRKARYYISDTPKNGFKLHPAFIRNGAEKERIYLSAYEGCLYDTSASAYITDDAQVADFNTDKMSSIANAKPMSGLSQNLTRANARKLAQNRGIGWEQMYIHTASATQLLLMIEYGTLNSQQAIGSGVVNKAVGSGNESENTGGTSSLGNTSGSVSNGEVSYRGEENVWGNVWKWEDGINIHNPNPFNNGEYGNVYIADNGFADNINALPYEDTNIYSCRAEAGAYISAFGYNDTFDWLFIPTETAGNSSLPVGDMLWSSGEDWRIAMLGSTWDVGSRVGAFALGLGNYYSDRGRHIGSRLVYIPDANENNRTQKQIDKDLSTVENGYIPNAGNNVTGGLNIQRSNGISFTTSNDNSLDMTTGGNININTNAMYIDLTDDLNIYGFDNVYLYSNSTYTWGTIQYNYSITMDSDGWLSTNTPRNEKGIHLEGGHSSDVELDIVHVFNSNNTIYENILYDTGNETLPYTIFKHNNGAMTNSIKHKISYRDVNIDSDTFFDITNGVPNLHYNEYELLITQNNALNSSISLPNNIDITIKPDKDALSNEFTVSDDVIIFDGYQKGFITIENLVFTNPDTGSDTYLFDFGDNPLSTVIIRNCTFNNITGFVAGQSTGARCPANLIIENCTFNLNTPWEIYGATSYNHKLIFNNNVITNSGIVIKLSNTPNTGYEGIISNNAGNLTFSGTGTGKIKAWNNVATYTTY